jgi:glyoxylase-like metal-dependent hydrolase (beta-lactamase superfamily II)
MDPAAVLRIVAPNPGPMTLEGTNTYLVGANPAIVIDPGPADAAHISAVREAAAERGGIGAVLLTHSHSDHADGVALLGVDPHPLADGEALGGLRAIATPGHAEDHLCFLMRDHEGTACFTGDLILGEGSTIVAARAHGGSLVDYMASLRRLQELELALLLPGHGPEVMDPAAKIAEYVEHRLDRERRLVAALDRGERSRARLLDEVWDDVPAVLRPAAGIALEAHLEKLGDEGRVPTDIEE